jgi:hypothetical protein
MTEEVVTIIPKTILVELQVEVKHLEITDSYGVNLTHPDLKGNLQFITSSENIVRLQLEQLDKSEKDSGDPFQMILKSAGKLMNSVEDLKTALKS